MERSDRRDAASTRRHLLRERQERGWIGLKKDRRQRKVGQAASLNQYRDVIAGVEPKKKRGFSR
jgi:hypothetical protein